MSEDPKALVTQLLALKSSIDTKYDLLFEKLDDLGTLKREIQAKERCYADLVERLLMAEGLRAPSDETRAKRVKMMRATDRDDSAMTLWLEDFRQLTAQYGPIAVVNPDTFMLRSGLSRDQCKNVVQCVGSLGKTPPPEGVDPKSVRRSREPPVILVGFFDNPDRRLLAFFWGLAMATQTFQQYKRNDTHDAAYIIERWQRALLLADHHGYGFRSSTLAWMLEQIGAQIEGMAAEKRSALARRRKRPKTKSPSPRRRRGKVGAR